MAPLWPRQRSTAVSLLGLLAVQAVSFFLVTRRAFFATDDFHHFRLAEERGFFHYLVTPILDVYPAPGHRLTTYVLQAVFPLDHVAARAFFLVVLAATTVLLGQLVRTFARSEEWWTVPLLTPFALSLTLVSPVWWWSNGIPVFPALFFTAVTLIAWLRSYTGPHRSAALGITVAAIAAAGAFHIKFLLIPAYLLFLRLTILPRLLDVPGGIRDLWAERARWVAVAAPGVAFVAVLVLGGMAGRSAVPGERPYLAYFAIAWFEALVPVSFLNIPLDASTSRPFAWTVVIAGQALLWAAVVVTWRRSALAAHGWGLFVVAFALNAAMVGAVRLPGFGAELAYTLRYYPEVVFFLPVALALGLRQGEERRPGVAWERTASGRVVIAAFACLFAVSFVVWAPRTVQGSDGALTRDWVENLREDVGAVAADGAAPHIVDSETPEFVMPSWMPDNRVSSIMALLGIDAVYDELAEPMYLTLADGRLAEAAFDPVASLWSGSTAGADVRVVGADAASEGTCIRDGGWLRYRPQEDLAGTRLAIRVVYAGQGSGGPVTLEVETDDADRPTRHLELRPHEREAELVDLATSRLRALRLVPAPGGSVCIDRLEVGALKVADQLGV